MKIRANGLDIEVRDSATESTDPAHRQRPPVLLVMGMVFHLTDWPEPFVQGLVEAGYRVVCFDNRDAGLSTHMDALGEPGVWWFVKYLGLRIRRPPPYRIADMVADALGVVDALGIDRFHVVGMSMGGMVAQRMALSVPRRVLSLTSMMSSSGARGLPWPHWRVLWAALPMSRFRSLEGAVERHFQFFRTVASTTHAPGDQALREQVRRRLSRDLTRSGPVRQLAASVADPGRAASLARIVAPTLVLHGTTDPLLPLRCGQDTARRIPGARLVGIEGMGHDLAPVHFQTMLGWMVEHLRAAQVPGLVAPNAVGLSPGGAV